VEGKKSRVYVGTHHKMQEDGETKYTDAGGWRDGVYGCRRMERRSIRMQEDGETEYTRVYT
jgi:hypothetical protein